MSNKHFTFNFKFFFLRLCIIQRNAIENHMLDRPINYFFSTKAIYDNYCLLEQNTSILAKIINYTSKHVYNYIYIYIIKNVYNIHRKPQVSTHILVLMFQGTIMVHN